MKHFKMTDNPITKIFQRYVDQDHCLVHLDKNDDRSNFVYLGESPAGAVYRHRYQTTEWDMNCGTYNVTFERAGDDISVVYVTRIDDEPEAPLYEGLSADIQEDMIDFRAQLL